MKIIFNLLLWVFTLPVHAGIQKTDFDKGAFYSAMASTDISTVNKQLQIIKSCSINEKEAYEGALLMRKAGLLSNIKEKLNLFKAGRSKLEAAIKKDKENAEYNFLRLIIQEHAPKMVEYRYNMENDISIIRSSFKTLAPVVQQAIQDYSKKSKVLKPIEP